VYFDGKYSAGPQVEDSGYLMLAAKPNVQSLNPSGGICSDPVKNFKTVGSSPDPKVPSYTLHNQM